ncbi:MAG: hypothetical protein KC488_10340, partial [Candidatus Cloacimonetes bacterium]|nr:hypothetical protein [Candidatus Cloacimonadota bacterium]
AFLRVGSDARTLGIGNTGIAWPGGPASRLNNPALVAWEESAAASLGMVSLSMDRSLNSVHAVLPLKPMGALGISWTGAGVGGIPETTSWGETTGRDMAYAENSFSFGFGVKPGKAVALGISLAINSAAFQQVTDGGGDIKANSASFGAGLSLHPMDDWWGGLSLTNLMGTYEWDSGDLWGQDGEARVENSTPSLFGVGLAHTLLDKHLLLCADYQASSEKAWDLRLGAEYSNHQGENGDWAARAGYDSGNFSLGGGYGWQLRKVHIGLDYAVVIHQDDPSEIHAFNFNFGF